MVCYAVTAERHHKYLAGIKATCNNWHYNMQHAGTVFVMVDGTSDIGKKLKRDSKKRMRDVKVRHIPQEIYNDISAPSLVLKNGKPKIAWEATSYEKL